jgi:hypothetical protein
MTVTGYMTGGLSYLGLTSNILCAFFFEFINNVSVKNYRHMK